MRNAILRSLSYLASYVFGTLAVSLLTYKLLGGTIPSNAAELQKVMNDVGAVVKQTQSMQPENLAAKVKEHNETLDAIGSDMNFKIPEEKLSPEEMKMSIRSLKYENAQLRVKLGTATAQLEVIKSVCPQVQVKTVSK